jgi:hypothetical protein
MNAAWVVAFLLLRVASPTTPAAGEERIKDYVDAKERNTEAEHLECAHHKEKYGATCAP